MLTLSDRLRVPDHVVGRRVGAETVILDLNSGICFGLSAVGGRFFELLDVECELSSLATMLVDEFDVAYEQIAADLLDLSSELLSNGLLERT